MSRERVEELAHDLGDSAADAGIDLVEHEGGDRGLSREQHLDGKRQARELPARGDLGERCERLAGMGRDLQLDRLEAARARDIEWIEGDLKLAAAHGETLHRRRDLAAELARSRAPRLR